MGGGGFWLAQSACRDPYQSLAPVDIARILECDSWRPLAQMTSGFDSACAVQK